MKPRVLITDVIVHSRAREETSTWIKSRIRLGNSELPLMVAADRSLVGTNGWNDLKNQMRAGNGVSRVWIDGRIENVLLICFLDDDPVSRQVPWLDTGNKLENGLISAFYVTSIVSDRA